jgi:hypothetical protein
VKTYYLEFKYNATGKGPLRLHNDSLIGFDITGNTGRVVKNELRKAIEPGKYKVVGYTRNVIKLETGMKISTCSSDVSNTMFQVYKKCGEIDCYVNIPHPGDTEDIAEVKKENVIKRSWNWFKKSLRWKAGK